MSVPRRRARALVWATLGLAIVACFLAWRYFLTDDTPPLGLKDFERARALWERQRLLDYDITVRKEVDARPDEILRTEVRGGKATRLLVNGAAVPPRDSYSVPGLLDIAEQELAMVDSKAPLAGQPRGAILRALFHERLGAPLVIKRIAGNRQSYILRVERLEVPGGEVVWQAR